MKRQYFIIIGFALCSCAQDPGITQSDSYEAHDQSIYGGFVALSEKFMEVHIDTTYSGCREWMEPELNHCIQLGDVRGRCSPDECISEVVINNTLRLNGSRIDRGFHARIEHGKDVGDWINFDVYGCQGIARFGLEVPPDFEVPRPTLRIINYWLFARWEPQGAENVAITYPYENGTICVVPDNGSFETGAWLNESDLGLEYRWAVTLLGRTRIKLYRAVPAKSE